MSTEGEQWICASCGARVETDDAPCPNCAGETFARLEDDEYEIGRIESITWVCENCGEPSQRNETPCRNCGGFDYRKQVHGTPSENKTHSVADTESQSPQPRTITLRLIVAYLFGGWAALSFIGALVFGTLFASLFYLTSASLSLPISRRWIERGLNIQLSSPAVAVIAVTTFFIGNGVFLASV